MSMVVKDQARNLRVIARRKETFSSSFPHTVSSDKKVKENGNRKVSLTLFVILFMTLVGAVVYIYRQNQFLNSLEEENRSMAEKLTQLTESIAGFKGVLSLSLEENRALQRQISKLKEEKELILQDLHARKIQINHLEEKIREVEESLDKVKEVRNSLPGISIVERKVSQGETIGTSSEGRVVFIDRVYRFVVIDRGQEDMIRPGDFFGVYDKGKLIALVKVVRVRRRFSACDIIDGMVEGIPTGAEVRKL